MLELTLDVYNHLVCTLKNYVYELAIQHSKLMYSIMCINQQSDYVHFPNVHGKVYTCLILASYAVLFSKQICRTNLRKIYQTKPDKDLNLVLQILLITVLSMIDQVCEKIVCKEFCNQKWWPMWACPCFVPIFQYPLAFTVVQRAVHAASTTISMQQGTQQQQTETLQVR